MYVYDYILLSSLFIYRKHAVYILGTKSKRDLEKKKNSIMNKAFQLARKMKKKHTKAFLY